MAKATSPYLSEVRGSVAKKLTFRKLKPYDTQLIQSIPVPSYRRTEKQNAQRNKFLTCKNIWNSMSNEDKEKYRAMAEQLGLTLYQSFMSKCLSELILYDVLIDNTQNPNDLINFQVPLEITNDPQFFADCQYNKNALSFMTEDLKDPIPYYIEDWNPDTKSALIWLKVPLIKASSITTVKLLIVPSKQTTESDGEAVFEFFDDFNGTELDTSKWDYQNVVVEDGILKSTADNGLITSKTAPVQAGGGAIVEARVMLNADYDTDLRLIYDGNNYVFLRYSTYVGGSLDGHSQLQKMVGGSGSIIAFSFGPQTVKGEWALLRLTKKDSTTYIAYVKNSAGEGSYTATISDSVFVNNDLKVGWYGQHANDYLDWIRVRKYAESEPVVTYKRIS